MYRKSSIKIKNMQDEIEKLQPTSDCYSLDDLYSEDFGAIPISKRFWSKEKYISRRLLFISKIPLLEAFYSREEGAEHIGSFFSSKEKRSLFEGFYSS